MILEKFDKVKGHLFIRSRTTNSRILLNIPVNWFPVFFVINKPEIRRICFIHDEIITINQFLDGNLDFYLAPRESMTHTQANGLI